MLMKRLLFAVAVVLGVVLAGAGPAYAHNSLVKATPDKDVTLVDAPADVTLTFLASLDPKTTLTVTGPGGASAIGAFTIDGKVISAPFTATAGGVYTVGYELISADGHPVQSTYKFTLQGKAEVTSAAAAPVPTETATTMPKEQETSWFPWIGGAAVAGLLVGGLITFLRNRRERA